MPLLELYHDLRTQHSGWAQRIHATCFHQGATAPGQAGVVCGDRQRLASIVEAQMSPVGQLQVNTALAVMDVLDEHVDRLRRRLLTTARHVHGARVLMHEIYGAGAMTSPALCAWLGGADRFSSSRKAVRFVGLDVTVHLRTCGWPRPGTPAAFSGPAPSRRVRRRIGGTAR